MKTETRRVKSVYWVGKSLNYNEMYRTRVQFFEFDGRLGRKFKEHLIIIKRLIESLKSCTQRRCNEWLGYGWNRRHFEQCDREEKANTFSSYTLHFGVTYSYSDSELRVFFVVCFFCWMCKLHIRRNASIFAYQPSSFHFPNVNFPNS